LPDSPSQAPQAPVPRESPRQIRNFLLGFVGGVGLSFIVLVLGRDFLFQPGGGEGFGVGIRAGLLLLPFLGCCKLALGLYLWFLPRWKTLGAGIVVSVPVGVLIFFGVCASYQAH